MTLTDRLGTHAEVAVDSGLPAPAVDVVIPVYNEEHDVGPNVRRLHAFLRDEFPLSARITIADNASTDSTWPLACALASELPGVRALRLAQKGRGRALHATWHDNDATVVAYMDVDLSTDLRALLPLVAPVLSGHSDLAIGTRLTRASKVVRGPKREIISRGYNLLLRAILGTRFSDAQCGFKAIRSDRAKMLLPLVQDNDWFFDTELLVLAERAGLRIHEVPVDWTDDSDSRVDVLATAMADLQGIARVARGLLAGTIPLEALRAGVGSVVRQSPNRLRAQLMSFALVGVLSTLAYLASYSALRWTLPPLAANAIALFATGVANTAANRRLTFGVLGSADVVRHHVQGLSVFALALVITSGSLGVLHALAPTASRPVELAVLVLANLAATVARFLLLRGWVFGRRRSSIATSVPSSSWSTP